MRIFGQEEAGYSGRASAESWRCRDASVKAACASCAECNSVCPAGYNKASDNTNTTPYCKFKRSADYIRCSVKPSGGSSFLINVNDTGAGCGY